MESEHPAPGGIGTLSRPARVAVRGAVVLTGLAVVLHFTAVILHVWPQSALAEKYAAEVHAYVWPEFKQNWRMFAPNPLSANVEIHARAELRRPDGSSSMTDWVDLTAQDVEDTHGSLAPSRTRNQLRKSWPQWVTSHDKDGKPTTLTGQVLDLMYKRLAVLRLGERFDADTIDRIQLRSVSVNVPEPSWSDRRSNLTPRVRETPWMRVTAGDHTVRRIA